MNRYALGKMGLPLFNIGYQYYEILQDGSVLCQIIAYNEAQALQVVHALNCMPNAEGETQ